MYSAKLHRTAPQTASSASLYRRPPAVPQGASPVSQSLDLQAQIDAAARFGHSLAKLVAPAPASPVIQRMKDGDLEDGTYYLVRYQENQLTARLIGRKGGDYQLVVVGSSAVIQVSDPEDIIMPVRYQKGKEEASQEEPQLSGKKVGAKRTHEEADIEESETEETKPTTCVILHHDGTPEAIVHDDLVNAYLADLQDDSQHHLQEGDGQAIAQHLGVTANVMAQVAGPLIRSTTLRYGNGPNPDGTLLHIGGNHYVVLNQVDPGVTGTDFVDTDGNGYVEGEATVADGNCLIDGLHLIRDHQHASPEEIAEDRGVAAQAGGQNREGVRQILAATIIDTVQGKPPGGIGAHTQNYIDRDPNVETVRLELQRQKAKKAAEKAEKAELPLADDEENEAMIEEPPLDRKEEQVKGSPKPVSSSPSGEHGLEDAVTRYLLDVNRLGEEKARKLPAHRLVLELWHARFGRSAPDAGALGDWLEDREREMHGYFGSDTESEGESGSSSEEDEGAPAWDEENYALLDELNQAIGTAKTEKDIEAILGDKRFQRFVVPQFRGIAYMTNRFGKAKRREHRQASQVGKPVFADAVRPPEMPREEFYTQTHGKDSEVERNKAEILQYLAKMRRPSPVVDPKRRIAKGKRSGRIFPTPFHVLQSDYSQDYTKSGEKIASHYDKNENKRHSRPWDDPKAPFDEQVYGGIPFRSHPFVSTADQPRHAVRYALGNKPITAEKAFRLRPRWRSSGKPQHPYSGKVYTSLHPLRDYLSPTAPSSVWMGRAQGTLSIDNDISKEGESSFLAAIKPKRVVREQVIRWPSLEVSKDEFGGQGLPVEKRRAWRKMLEKYPPHSKEQRGMKSGKLGMEVEEHYTEKVAEATRREAGKRGQLLVYRNLTGGFSAEPPEYKTPGSTVLKPWELPAKKETQEQRLKDIKEGKLKLGHATEGFFPKWPSEEFYSHLSDDERGSDADDERDLDSEDLRDLDSEDGRISEGRGMSDDERMSDSERKSDDGRMSIERPKSKPEIPQATHFLNDCRPTIAETQRALDALPLQRNVTPESALAAGRRLAQRAYVKIHQEALAGWKRTDLTCRQLTLPPTGVPPLFASAEKARVWLEAQFAEMIAALQVEAHDLAHYWGPGEGEDEEDWD